MDHLLPSRLQIPLLHTDQRFIRMECCTEQPKSTRHQEIPTFCKGNSNYVYNEARWSALPTKGLESLCWKRYTCTHDQHMEIWPSCHHRVVVREESAGNQETVLLDAGLLIWWNSHSTSFYHVYYCIHGCIYQILSCCVSSACPHVRQPHCRDY